MANREIMAMLDTDGYVSVRQTAQQLGCSPQAIYAAIHTQRLPAIRAGGFWLLHKDDVSGYIVDARYQRNGRALKRSAQ